MSRCFCYSEIRWALAKTLLDFFSLVVIDFKVSAMFWTVKLFWLFLKLIGKEPTMILIAVRDIASQRQGHNYLIQFVFISVR